MYCLTWKGRGDTLQPRPAAWLPPALGDSASSTSGTAVLNRPLCHCAETVLPLSVNGRPECALLPEVRSHSPGCHRRSCRQQQSADDPTCRTCPFSQAADR